MVLASFFVMSGFFLEMRHSFQSIDSKRWIKFEINHFSRLFPLQWLCVAAWLMLSTTPLNANAIYHYFLVQSWVPDSKVYFYANGSSWFISTLLFLYLLFPIISSATKRIPRVCLISVLTCVMALMTYLNITIMPPYYRQIFPPARIVDFTIGVVLYQNLSKVMHSETSRCAFQKLIKALDMVLILIIVGASTFSISTLAVPVAWGLISAILSIFTLSAHWGVKGIVYGALSRKVFTQLGKISFEIYMIHEIVFASMKHICPILGMQCGGAAYITTGFIIVLSASMLIHHSFVRPINKNVRKWSNALL